MIQRIQSIYLLLSAALLGGQFALPYASAPAEKHAYFADGLWNIQDNKGLLLFSVVAILSCVVAIFWFKNRKQQSWIARAASIFALAVAVNVCLDIYFISHDSGTGLNNITFQVGIAFPVLVFVLIALAQRAIRKDEDLVRSMDRLR
jgi:hypothetical protein